MDHAVKIDECVMTALDRRNGKGSCEVLRNKCLILMQVAVGCWFGW
jgi:hypothetical protein